MYIYNIIGQYSFAAISGLIGIILIMLRGKSKQKEKLIYRSAVIFVLNIAAMGLLLCYVFLQETLFARSDVITPIRALDYLLYAALLFSWVNLLAHLCSESDKNYPVAPFLCGKIVSLLGIILFLWVAVVCMNDFYYIESDIWQSFYRVLEIVFSVAASALVIICVLKSLRFILISYTRKYVLFTSAFVVTYFITQIWWTSEIGETKALAWNLSLIDYSGWLLTIINGATCFFIYKKDFQQVYKPAESREIVPETPMAVLDKIAAAHKLTHREREIIELVYAGASNAAIAEQLFITLNTVKSHMKNIFEKMGISSRMELTYVINQQLLYDSKRADAED